MTITVIAAGKTVEESVQFLISAIYVKEATCYDIYIFEKGHIRSTCTSCVSMSKQYKLCAKINLEA